MKRGPGLALAVAAATAACSEPAAPRRDARFSYADTVAGQPVVFRWNATDLPVRYYAYPDGSLPALVHAGLAAWERQFLYGEFRAALVSDSGEADVIVAFAREAPPPAVPDRASVAAACDGVTAPVFGTPTVVERPLRVTLDWFNGFTPGEVAACLERVSAHELGHSLGLFNQAHAGTGPDDLMAPAPQVYWPGPRDRATVEVLYHTERTVAPEPR